MFSDVLIYIFNSLHHVGILLFIYLLIVLHGHALQNNRRDTSTQPPCGQKQRPPGRRKHRTHRNGRSSCNANPSSSYKSLPGATLLSVNHPSSSPPHSALGSAGPARTGKRSGHQQTSALGLASGRKDPVNLMQINANYPSPRVLSPAPARTSPVICKTKHNDHQTRMSTLMHHNLRSLSATEPCILLLVPLKTVYNSSQHPRTKTPPARPARGSGASQYK